MGGVGFEVTRNVAFQESGSYNMYYRKINNYTSRTNRMHKSMDIQVIYLDIQVNTLITLTVPCSPIPSNCPPVNNFFLYPSHKNYY